jgi:hypothetical protein
LRIYVSGPITGIENYRQNFDDAEKFLTELGYAVINPAKIDDCLPEGIMYDEFLDLDLYLMSMCDGVYLLNGWNNSRGAKKEISVAINAGMDIFTEAEKERILSAEAYELFE